MRRALGVLGLLAAGLAPAQEPESPRTRLAELQERAAAIEHAIVQFHLGLAPEARLLEAIAPQAAGEPEALAAEHAVALEELARLTARHRQLTAGVAPVPASTPGPKERPQAPVAAPDPPRPSAAERAPQGREAKAAPALPFPRPPVDAAGLADALFREGRYEQALLLYGGLVAEGRGGARSRHREALCLERLAWAQRRSGESGAGAEQLALARKKYATLAEQAAGSPWAEAARFALADIEWRLGFEARGALPGPPGESRR